MNSKIYLVGGGKGGVGKSMVAMALLDHIQSHSVPVLLIESDSSNPDVWKSYRDDVDVRLLNLDGANGWIELVKVLDANKDHVAVINTPARNDQGVSRYGETLASRLGELKRTLITLWVVNRQRDSLELLKEYMETIPNSQVHVVRNGYFGEEEAFELYNGSNIRKAVEAKGGKSLTFPRLANRVADAIYTKRLSLAKAGKELPIGNRAELRRWLTLTSRVFGEVVS
ncbi:protein mobD [Xanthomonas perforans]|uniref:nucleotide-binding protein n=1 Tax=Xanthomonas euvesicatoria TaxID=456327 RepID=UPI0009CEBA2B|nr:protein mobD [Xanthomonas euvesicatoria]MBZ2491661.1 protein mobD [Xanthomonas perforans]OOX24388.1 protein mobD [Xanthomonas campestris pv. azadirachtae]MBZ2530877.1 protein mobD [Xanthomonas perforans]MBZ2750995.1 protein mobD [Xanthomonas perforans]WOP50644.1 protein mobD [Xanthomonas euvesicatoria]